MWCDHVEWAARNNDLQRAIDGSRAADDERIRLGLSHEGDHRLHLFRERLVRSHLRLRPVCVHSERGGSCVERSQRMEQALHSVDGWNGVLLQRQHVEMGVPSHLGSWTIVHACGRWSLVTVPTTWRKRRPDSAVDPIRTSPLRVTATSRLVWGSNNSTPVCLDSSSVILSISRDSRCRAWPFTIHFVFSIVVRNACCRFCSWVFWNVMEGVLMVYRLSSLLTALLPSRTRWWILPPL